MKLLALLLLLPLACLAQTPATEGEASTQTLEPECHWVLPLKQNNYTFVCNGETYSAIMNTNLSSPLYFPKRPTAWQRLKVALIEVGIFIVFVLTYPFAPL